MHWYIYWCFYFTHAFPYPKYFKLHIWGNIEVSIKAQTKSEAVIQKCSVRKVRTTVFSCEFCEIFNINFFNRTSLVAASAKFYHKTKQNFTKFTRKHLCQSLCEIFKNTFFTEHLWGTASETNENGHQRKPDFWRISWRLMHNEY